MGWERRPRSVAAPCSGPLSNVGLIWSDQRVDVQLTSSIRAMWTSTTSIGVVSPTRDSARVHDKKVGDFPLGAALFGRRQKQFLGRRQAKGS